MTGVTESGHLYDSDPVLCIHKYSSFQRISLFYHLYLNLLIPLDKRYDEILFDSSTNSSSFLLDTFFFFTRKWHTPPGKFGMENLWRNPIENRRVDEKYLERRRGGGGWTRGGKEL